MSYLSHKLTSYDNIFKNLYDNQNPSARYSDVTLVFDDLKTYNAHKFILGQFSGLFEQILQHEGHQYVYLHGVSSSVLHLVMQYLYNGEVNVDKTRPTMFYRCDRQMFESFR